MPNTQIGKVWSDVKEKTEEVGQKITDETEIPVKKTVSLAQRTITHFVNNIMFSEWWTAPVVYIIILLILYSLIKCWLLSNKGKRRYRK